MIAEKVGTGSSLLIADDDPDMREILSAIFMHAGLNVATAVDGLNAWEQVVRRQPDVILIDMEMPGLSGEQLCRAIRGHPQLRTTPVVVLSGKLLPHDSCCHQAGSSVVLLEPTSNRTLLSTITRLPDERVSAPLTASA